MLCRLVLSSWQIPTYQKDLNSMRASMRQTRQLSMAGLKKDTRTIPVCDDATSMMWKGLSRVMLTRECRSMKVCVAQPWKVHKWRLLLKP
jgi:hypothetical protein